ncbi:hypothetical protein T492DRAFT_1003085 [Pavlovales sp. CCMP2436]|nr:hypothetical protein T492DRAFT_1003085 [Pavlovales sp. CCMP2436]
MGTAEEDDFAASMAAEEEQMLLDEAVAHEMLFEETRAAEEEARATEALTGEDAAIAAELGEERPSEGLLIRPHTSADRPPPARPQGAGRSTPPKPSAAALGPRFTTDRRAGGFGDDADWAAAASTAAASPAARPAAVPATRLFSSAPPPPPPSERDALLLAARNASAEAEQESRAQLPELAGVLIPLRSDGSGNAPQEWTMIEMQGAVETSGLSLVGLELGELTLISKEKARLRLGRKVLEGSVVSLNKPQAVLSKQMRESINAGIAAAASAAAEALSEGHAPPPLESGKPKRARLAA